MNDDFCIFFAKIRVGDFDFYSQYFNIEFLLNHSIAKRQVKMTTIMPEITPHRLPNHRNEISFTRDDETAQALLKNSFLIFNQIFYIEHIFLNISK